MCGDWTHLCAFYIPTLLLTYTPSPTAMLFLLLFGIFGSQYACTVCFLVAIT